VPAAVSIVGPDALTVSKNARKALIAIAVLLVSYLAIFQRGPRPHDDRIIITGWRVTID
jgi:hypothetical protein